MIGALKKLITNKNIDGYIVPKNDEFFSEYAFPNRLKFASNFCNLLAFSSELLINES